jgi:molecular chaperone IbpA
MTNLQLRSIDIPQLHRYGVGFDSMFDRIEEILRINSQHQTNYPPYNMIKYDDNKYAVEIAIAGFKQNEVYIEVKENQLSIEGKQAEVVDDTREYVHRGISGRDFVRMFTLADHVEVVGARQENGILTIDLERKIPDEKKAKVIPITYVS